MKAEDFASGLEQVYRGIFCAVYRAYFEYFEAEMRNLRGFPLLKNFVACIAKQVSGKLMNWR
jgi:hypothetical protein